MLRQLTDRRAVKRGALRILRRVFASGGFDLYRRQPNYHYVPDFHGRSARKHIDIRAVPQFGMLAQSTIAQGRTLLYYDRLYTIYQALEGLQRHPGALTPINMVEVGVYKGGTSHFIASAANALGLKSASLHCFDTFEGHAGEDIKAGIDTAHKTGFFGDTLVDAVKEYLKGFKNVHVYKGRFQDTCSAIEDLAIHFVHLDVDIYEPTLFGLHFFDTRLIVGGTIVVDDYGFKTSPGVKKAVEEFLETKPNYSRLHILTGQCVLVKYRAEDATE